YNTITMIKECLQFLIEPAKNLKIRLKESRRRVQIERREPLTESQLFIMELARELTWICQRSDVLAHIWTGEDIWPPGMCKEFILKTASILEMKEKSERPPVTRSRVSVEKRDWTERLLCVLEGEENDLNDSKRTIMDWTHSQRNMHPHGIWPGEPVLLMLDDLELQWKRGRLLHLQAAIELLIWVALGEHLDKELIPRLWLVQKQKSQNVDATRYIPHTEMFFMCIFSVELDMPWCRYAVHFHALVICIVLEVTLNPKTAHPALLVSDDGKRLRCVPELLDVPRCRQRFDGWLCALGTEGFSCGRHYWEVEVGDRDWRLGVANESALRRGYGFLNTQSGYYTLRLERGSELKVLTLPVTPLSPAAMPKRVGVYLDYEEGQLSFYDIQRRSHIYTFCERFTEALFPVFGTAEMVRDMVIRPAGLRWPCTCNGPCLFG
ncbi:hypothetical protein NFI96_015220, partial [Prochilodus magdalenae]